MTRRIRGTWENGRKNKAIKEKISFAIGDTGWKGKPFKRALLWRIMHLKLHKVELAIDAIIPYSLIVLLAVIILEFFYHDWVKAYNLQLPISVADNLIVGIFVADLAFKYRRVKNIPQFIRKYWLDIIAVFPFFLFFRVFGRFLRFFSKETIESGQMIMHESLEVERGAAKLLSKSERLESGAAKIIESAEKAGKASRARYFARLLRPLARSPRLAKIHQRLSNAFAFYEKPTGKHHPVENKIR